MNDVLFHMTGGGSLPPLPSNATPRLSVCSQCVPSLFCLQQAAIRGRKGKQNPFSSSY